MTNSTIQEINEMKKKVIAFGVEPFHLEKAIIEHLEGNVEDAVFYKELLKEEVWSFVDVEFQYVCIILIDSILFECKRIYSK